MIYAGGGVIVLWKIFSTALGYCIQWTVHFCMQCAGYASMHKNFKNILRHFADSFLNYQTGHLKA